MVAFPKKAKERMPQERQQSKRRQVPVLLFALAVFAFWLAFGSGIQSGAVANIEDKHLFHFAPPEPVFAVVREASVSQSEHNNAPALSEDRPLTTQDTPPELVYATKFAREHLVNWQDVLSPTPRNKDKLPTKFFWHVPKASGTSIKEFLHCIELVSADQMGTVFAPDGLSNETLTTYKYDDMTLLNIDPSTGLEGILRAREMGFVGSNLADVVASIYFQEVVHNLFDPENPAIAFSVFRDPLARAVSLFWYLQKAHWETTYRPDFKNLTLEEYFTPGKGSANNWMTRQLVGLSGDEIVTEEHYRIAESILKTKFVVGLATHFEESVERFVHFFGWKDNITDTRYTSCFQRYIQKGVNRNTDKKKFELKGAALKAAVLQNEFDIRLYKVAEALFEQQTMH